MYRKSLSAAQNKAVQLAARMSVMEMEKTPGPSKERPAGLRARGESPATPELPCKTWLRVDSLQSLLGKFRSALQ